MVVFLLAFEFVRHVAWPDLLHTPLVYVGSLVVVFVTIIGFNQMIFQEMGHMQRDLAQQTSYLDLLIESSGNAIITMDRDGTITSWNQGAEQTYGWRRDEVQGKVMPMVPAPLRDQGRGILMRVWNGETVRNIETRRLRKDGSDIPVLFTASPIRDAAGAVVSLLGISTDLSDRKRAESDLLEQQRATAVLQERERLARELHDDLGQILGFLSTQSQAARASLTSGRPEQADQYLKRLTEVAQDAHADIRDYILSLKTNVSPAQPFVPTLRAYVTRYGHNNGIQVAFSSSPGLDGLDLGPFAEAQVLRIVQEALTNVRKHAAARSVSVTLDSAGHELAVAIVDDGRGFNVAIAGSEDGRHFGQAIMRERAAEIGGRVDVESSPDAGTRVTLRVPLDGAGEVSSP